MKPKWRQWSPCEDLPQNFLHQSPHHCYQKLAWGRCLSRSINSLRHCHLLGASLSQLWQHRVWTDTRPTLVQNLMALFLLWWPAQGRRLAGQTMTCCSKGAKLLEVRWQQRQLWPVRPVRLCKRILLRAPFQTQLCKIKLGFKGLKDVVWISPQLLEGLRWFA